MIASINDQIATLEKALESINRQISAAYEKYEDDDVVRYLLSQKRELSTSLTNLQRNESDK